MTAWKPSLGGDNGDVKWHLKGRNFSHCNCSYGCPCQFNALPTHGNCEAVVGIVVDEGNHGGTTLDGLKFAGVFYGRARSMRGNGQALPIVDERASPAQREAILRIMSGQDTERTGRDLLSGLFIDA